MKYRRVPLVKQLVQTECGLCCCAMILRYYYSKETLKELQEEVDVGRDGMSAANVKDFFIKRGFDSSIYKVLDSEGLKLIKEPFISFWQNKHYVVVEKYHKNMWYIKDPAEGIKVISDELFRGDFSGVVIAIKPTKNFLPQKKRKYNPWLDTLRLLLQSKKLLIQLMLLLLLTYGFTLGVTFLIQKIIDISMVSESASYLKMFQIITVLFCGIYLSSIIVRGLKLVTLNVALGRSLEADTFKNLLHLKYKFFEMRTSGDLLFRLNSTSGVKELISSQILNGIIDIGTTIVILYYMIQKSIILAAVSVGIFALNFVIMLIIQPKLSHAINNELTEKTKSQMLQVEALYTMEYIKTACIEDDIYQKWEQGYKKVIETFKNRMNINNLSSSITMTIQIFAPVAILILGIYQYRNGNMTIGQVIAFQTISATFFGFSTNIFSTYTQYLLASDYLERISDIWYSKKDEESKKSLIKEISGDIKLNNVSYAYSINSAKVLKNISLKIKAGTKVAIVGASGSGKSTLSKLLVGLYEPTEGTILYDSIPFADYNKKALCSQMGIVPQDALLFNKTIYENIVMNSEISMEDVHRVAIITCIDEEINAMPMGYNTVVSEMGLNLSGGQRQRILLARSLIQKPKIIILDEATSSLDYINEKAISNYLSREGVTRIIIAHRLSTIVDSDEIYVFAEGGILERGTHDELMKLNGEYTRLYSSGMDVDVSREN